MSAAKCEEFASLKKKKAYIDKILDVIENFHDITFGCKHLWQQVWHNNKRKLYS